MAAEVPAEEEGGEEVAEEESEDEEEAGQVEEAELSWVMGASSRPLGFASLDAAPDLSEAELTRYPLVQLHKQALVASSVNQIWRYLEEELDVEGLEASGPETWDNLEEGEEKEVVSRSSSTGSVKRVRFADEVGSYTSTALILRTWLSI